MPRANPGASFETAAKHLLRHLREPEALRKNPLTQPFFDEARGEVACAGDRIAIERIHAFFRTAAERCRVTDVDAGKAERARRQYAIAIQGCLSGVAVRTLAVELGISSTQYYRERAHIGVRIARCFRDAFRVAELRVALHDDFRYAMTRAASFAELGDVERARSEYERLLGASASPAHNAEILCERALLDIRGNARADVEPLLREVRDLVERPGAFTSRESAIARAHLDYVRGISAWASDPRGAIEAYRSALARLEEPARNQPEEARNLYLRVLFDYGESLTTFHNIGESVATLARAAKLAGSCGDSLPILSLKIEIQFQSFRGAMLSDPYGWQPLAQRLQTMLSLARRARSTGSVDLTLCALNALSQLQARSGNASDALRSIRSALALSSYHPTQEIFSEVSQRMARTLMYTPLWREVPNVIRAAGPPATLPVALSRKTLEAEYSLRTGRPARVSEILSNSPVPMRRPYMNVLDAQAADALGQRRRAHTLIEPAVPAIEKSDIALTIGLTYRIVGEITKDRRYRRKADEIARSLSA